MGMWTKNPQKSLKSVVKINLTPNYQYGTIHIKHIAYIEDIDTSRLEQSGDPDLSRIQVFWEALNNDTPFSTFG